MDFYRHTNMTAAAMGFLTEEELHWFRAEAQRQMMLHTDDQVTLIIIENFKERLDREWDRRHSIFNGQFKGNV